jgi:hypothetical protein
MGVNIVNRIHHRTVPSEFEENPPQPSPFPKGQDTLQVIYQAEVVLKRGEFGGLCRPIARGPAHLPGDLRG